MCMAKRRPFCFLYDTRLRFLVDGKDGGKGAPMSCALIYWGQRYDRFFEIFIRFGAVVNIENLKNVVIGQSSNNHQYEMELGWEERPADGIKSARKPKS